jgi:dTDP-glucose 4,6-dehydratase
VADRPGHDRRYCVDAALARRALDWSPRVALESGLRDTVRWYATQRDWWQRIISGAYLVERRQADPRGRV